MLAGVADLLTDIIAKVAKHDGSGGESGSLLLLGPPGVGKLALV